MLAAHLVNQTASVGTQVIASLLILLGCALAGASIAQMRRIRHDTGQDRNEIGHKLERKYYWGNVILVALSMETARRIRPALLLDALSPSEVAHILQAEREIIGLQVVERALLEPNSAAVRAWLQRRVEQLSNIGSPVIENRLLHTISLVTISESAPPLPMRASDLINHLRYAIGLGIVARQPPSIESRFSYRWHRFLGSPPAILAVNAILFLSAVLLWAVRTPSDRSRNGPERPPDITDASSVVEPGTQPQTADLGPKPPLAASIVPDMSGPPKPAAPPTGTNSGKSKGQPAKKSHSNQTTTSRGGAGVTDGTDAHGKQGATGSLQTASPVTTPASDQASAAGNSSGSNVGKK